MLSNYNLAVNYIKKKILLYKNTVVSREVRYYMFNNV